MLPISHLLRACAAAAPALILLVSPARAQEADIALSLDDAVAAVIARQPQLLALDAGVRAARESAAAAGQLPDPRLDFAVSDLTITGPDAYSLRRESDTQLVLGVMQDFPRAEKRRLLGERGAREIDWRVAELAQRRRELEREAALAWLDVWLPEQQRMLARAAVHESELQAQAADIAYRSGSAAQSEVLSARVALELLRDQAGKLEQDAAHARNSLRRWIGDDASRVLCPDLPDWPAPEPLDLLLTRLRAHPHLAATASQVAVADADTALARQDYRPDWRVELGYGYRPNFADYASLKFSIDLPVFTHDRQDRRLAAKLAEGERSRELAADDWREHAAELRLNYDDWQLLAGRIAHFDQAILPQSAQRIEAARLAWQSGAGTLAQVLDARRASLDLRMQKLELQADQARHRVRLDYLTGGDHKHE